MGNDGGSIARRDELVKVKIGKPVHEAARQRKARWLLCSLSKKPLKQPVVADGLGRMYNKEALVDWLIQVKVNEGKGKGEVDANMAHIKRLKVSSRRGAYKQIVRATDAFVPAQDVTELKLHENAAASAKGSKAGASSSNGDNDDEAMATPFACPLTGRPMNGSHRFVYIRAAGSGAVMSESGLKAVLGSASSSSSSTAVCPITSVLFEPGYIAQKAPASSSSSSSSIAPLTPANVADVIPLNPTAEEEVILRTGLQASAGKKDKKGKRKNGETVVGPEDGEAKVVKRPSPPSRPAEADDTTAATKRRRTEEHAGGSGERSNSPPSATAAVAASIAAMAAREAKAREKPLSANVLKGIYGK